MSGRFWRLLAVSLCVCGCVGSTEARVWGPRRSGGKDVLAKVGSETVTEAQVEERAQTMLARLNQQIYDVKRATVDELIAEIMFRKEAEAAGITVEQLLKREVQGKTPEVTQEEVDSFYERHKERLKRPKQEIAEALRQRIRKEKEGQRLKVYVAELRKKYNPVVLLEPLRVEIGVDDDPAMGPEDARVTVIEFCDYQCGFSRQVQPVVRKLRDEYKGKLRWVCRDFPLGFHKNAGPAAEAANCAREQGKFWEFQELLYENQSSLNEATFLGLAKKLGLDEKSFKECLTSGKYKQEVEKDIADANRIGVGATPSFFINGRLVEGAKPYEQFTDIIEDELSRAKSR